MEAAEGRPQVFSSFCFRYKSRPVNALEPLSNGVGMQVGLGRGRTPGGDNPGLSLLIRDYPGLSGGSRYSPLAPALCGRSIQAAFQSLGLDLHLSLYLRVSG